MTSREAPERIRLEYFVGLGNWAASTRDNSIEYIRSDLAGVVPEGWQLAPTRIDGDMKTAFWGNTGRWIEEGRDRIQELWTAMLAASPKPPGEREGTKIVTQPITLRMAPREDGGLRISSDELPGLNLSHNDHAAIFRDLPLVIRDLLAHSTYDPKPPVERAGATKCLSDLREIASELGILKVGESTSPSLTLHVVAELQRVIGVLEAAAPKPPVNAGDEVERLRAEAFEEMLGALKDAKVNVSWYLQSLKGDVCYDEDHDLMPTELSADVDRHESLLARIESAIALASPKPTETEGEWGRQIRR